MSEFNQKEWSIKIKKSSAKLNAETTEGFHPAFNHKGTGEITLPGDMRTTYRVPIDMWYNYHEAKYNTKIDRNE